MVSIEVNGVRLEADTLKDAQKLARKEEKRQTHEEAERNARVDIAYEYAFAHLGKLVNADRAGTLGMYLWLHPESGMTHGADGRDRLHIHAKDGTPTVVVTLDSYTTIQAIGHSHTNETVCVKLWDTSAERAYWYTVGGEGDRWAFVDVPEYLVVKLERLFAEEQARRAA